MLKRGLTPAGPFGNGAIGHSPHVADKILNHQAGTISGVAAVYQRHDFLAERKEAQNRWGRHVGEIVQAEVRAARTTRPATSVERSRDSCA
jgi:hypothetical protein